MTKATGIAMQSAPIDKTDLRKLRTALLAVAASVVLAACSGGAETTANSLANGGGNTNSNVYTGPVARDAAVLKFQQEFWANAKTTNRCGSCHNETVQQLPMFVRNDDVNMAYDAALTKVDTVQPSASELVAKVGSGHNCWVADPGVCSSIMTTWIENWLGDVAGGGRQIVLSPPIARDPDDSRNFPTDPGAFETLIHDPILEVYCANCHSSESVQQQFPYFADPNIESAYDAAKPKINLDTPANSRFVIKLRSEQHNCWDDCSSNAQEMEDAITAFAAGITPTTVNSDLIISKAMRLTDGVVASGGNRYEDAQIALWEFKTGSGLVAYDTSGVDPAIDLNLSQEVSWYGGWGITTNGGRAQGLTTTSAKLADVLQEAGEFTIEAWVVPANVTQENARIVTYSAGDMDRNFTLQQNLYDYNYLLRTSETSLDGVTEQLSTPADDEVLQATLQHVVATYHPIDGRRIYVNGDLVSDVDPVPGGTLIDWQNNFALILGSDASGNGSFEGTIRLAAIHRRALTGDQVTQNYDVGVGEKFYLLFDISENIAAAPQSSYILFEAAQYDTYSYLFDKPHFITLDGSSPEDIPIQGLRVAMNGIEGPVGQTYATLDDMLSAAEFVELGQPLSVLGAVLPLEKGPDDDDFFLTFDLLAADFYDRPADPTLVITPVDLDPASQIGLRTFDEINATFSSALGIDWASFTNVNNTYQELRQSLPAVEDINTFLSSHQVAVAQLAIAYCDALVNANGNPNPTRGQMFPGFNFDAAPGTAFAAGNRDLFVDPLINYIMGTGLTSQPAHSDVYDELAGFVAPFPVVNRPDNLVKRLVDGGSDTRAISKGVCAAMLGNAITLVQ